MKRTAYTFAAALMLLFVTLGAQARGLRRCTPAAAGMNASKLAQVDREIDAAIAEGSIPGAVIAVVRDKRIVYLKAYGNRQVVPDTVAMTTETMFDLASLSKCVGTTLAFLQLVENGKVRLSDEVRRYIPDFKPWNDPQTGREVHICIKDLMTHSSGLAAYINVDNYVRRYGPASPDALVCHIATEVRRNFEPGTGYLYSCLNYITLQNILERITGERLCDYVQTNVFDVLGLQHSCYCPKDRPALLPLVAPTEVQKDGTPLKGEVHDPTARIVNCGNSGNAGVFSTAEDLAVIAAAIMNGGAIADARILSPATVRAITTVQNGNGRALGWDIASTSSGLKGDLFNPERTICHTGYTGTSMVVDMESRTAVILLANRVHPADKGNIANLRARVSNIVAGAIENWTK